MKNFLMNMQQLVSAGCFFLVLGLITVDYCCTSFEPISVDLKIEHKYEPEPTYYKDAQGNFVDRDTIIEEEETKETTIKHFKGVSRALSQNMNNVPSNVQKFYERWRETAKAEDLKYNIPAAFKLAQGALESGWGSSKGALSYNAFFGIHYHSSDVGAWEGAVWEGDPNKDGYSKLCAYSTAWRSWRHHSQFLTAPKKAYRYGKLFERCNKKEFNEEQRVRCWCAVIDETGYCEKKNYGTKLMSIIERYDWVNKLQYDNT